MSIEKALMVSDHLPHILKKLGYIRSMDGLFSRNISEIETGVGISTSSGLTDIEFLIRHRSVMDCLARVMGNRLIQLSDNPFSQPWCFLFSIRVCEPFRDVLSNRHTDMFIEVLENELIRLGHLASNMDIRYWCEQAMLSKHFDGLSRYTIIFSMFTCDMQVEANHLSKYFASMMNPVERQNYFDQLDLIKAEFGLV